MKISTLTTILIRIIISANAQDNNILISLNNPINGIRIKANFPNYDGNWAREFFL